MYLDLAITYTPSSHKRRSIQESSGEEEKVEEEARPAYELPTYVDRTYCT
jgi:hypothetical protein